MSSIFDHLHIKRHTAGSSNELSFDVLDAARDDLNSKKKKKSSSPQVFRPARPQDDPGSYHATSGTATLAGQDEVTRRKRERKVHYARIWVAVAVVALGLMGAAAYVGYGQYARMQDFQAQFQQVVASIVEADENVPAIEEFMAAPFDYSKEDREEMRKMISYSLAKAEGIHQQEINARPYAVTDADVMALDNVGMAAQSRTKMFEAAAKAVEIAEASATETSEVNAIWRGAIKVDQEAREASEKANRASTEDEIRESKKATQEVKEHFEEVYAKLSLASEDSSDVDLAGYKTYLELRIQALDHALATSDALVKGDKETASLENDIYNDFERQAAALAETLPVSVGETVENAFEKEMGNCQSEYSEARDSAIEADSMVREYLD